MGTAIIALPAATSTSAGDVPTRLFKLLNAMVLAETQTAKASPDLSWVQKVADASDGALAVDTLLQQYAESEKAKEEEKKKTASLKEFRETVPKLLKQISRESPAIALPALQTARTQLDQQIKAHDLTGKEWKEGLSLIDALIKATAPPTATPRRAPRKGRKGKKP